MGGHRKAVTAGCAGNVRPTHVLVLLSGGIDSSSCVAFYRTKHFVVESLFGEYGQAAAVRERAAAHALSRHFDVPLLEASVQGVVSRDSGFVPGRNALLVCVALATAAPPAGLVALGIHAGTPYPDCTRRFVDACQALADVYTDGRIQIAAPFVDWSKADILAYARKVGVPLDQTYSCEAGGAAPCGVCLSCQDHERGR